MLFYGPSVPPQPGYGDTAEFQTVPYILGIAHPTGFPAFTLAGWIFSHAVAFGTVAWRMNLFAAICTALTAATVAVLATALECNAFAAIAAAVAFACGNLVWHGAAYANAHALAGLCIVAALTASVLFAKHGDRRALYTACACAGFGLATHPETIWVLPAIAVAIAWQRSAWRPRPLLLATALVLVPLLLYAYLPLRSAVVAEQHLDPAAASPLFGTGELDWDSNHPRTLDGFLNEVLGRHEAAGPSVVRSFDPSAIPAAAALWFVHARRQFDAAILVLAALGCGVLLVRDPRSLSVLIAGTVGALKFALVYRYDNSLDRYYLASLAVTAVLAAASTRLELPRLPPARLAAAVTLALVLSAGWTVFANFPLVAELHGGGSQPVIDAAARDTPDGAIIVTDWDAATALVYGASVERALGTRTVIVGWPNQYMDQYPRWARERPVVILAKWGTSVDDLPPSWLKPLSSSLPFYRWYAIASGTGK